MEKIKKFLMAGQPGAAKPEDIFRAVQDLFARQCLGSAALAINGAAGPTWKMTNAAALPYLINGTLLTKTAATAQAVPTAVSWAAVASTYNAGGFLIALDNAGNIVTFPTNITSTTTSAAAALAAIVWPVVPDTYCVIGAIVINNTAANTAFTGGTTNLDAANIGVNYINVTGPFYPVTQI